MSFLEDQNKEKNPLSKICTKIGLNKPNWDFYQTVEYLDYECTYFLSMKNDDPILAAHNYTKWDIAPEGFVRCHQG